MSAVKSVAYFDNLIHAKLLISWIELERICGHADTNGWRRSMRADASSVGLPRPDTIGLT